MKNKILLLGTLISLSIFSCKKEETTSLTAVKQDFTKFTLPGTWEISKMEITGPTKNGIVTVVDSSTNLSRTLPKFHFSADELTIENTKLKYEFRKKGNLNYLVLNDSGNIKNVKFQLLRELIVLQFNELEPTMEKTTSYYLKKINDEI